MENIKKAVELIKQGSVVAFCGSGLSRESGIPTFRGREGLWEKYDPNLYVTEDGLFSRLLHHPQDFRNFVLEFYAALIEAQPNAGHKVLKKLEDKGYLNGIITQNIDDFHWQAGSKKVAEIHGNAYSFICRNCGHKLKKDKKEWSDFLASIKDLNVKGKIIKTTLRFPGKCPACKIRRMESGIVLFGQGLPEGALQASYDFLRHAKILLCVGTNSVVYPAASFPSYAKECGAKIININISDNPLDETADLIYRCKSGDFFKELAIYL